MSDRPRLAPLCGFLALLAVVFAVSYGVGAAVGPDEPGGRRPVTETGTETETEPGTESDGHDMDGHDMGGMRGTHSGGHR
ncbi:hypothetical protein GCM10010277_56800 [Streptomyces longisporoflavus]|nr:hypothetical protein GCM10010277_56800 [Streptomyces longisporoflavus]